MNLLFFCKVDQNNSHLVHDDLNERHLVHWREVVHTHKLSKTREDVNGKGFMNRVP